jgi:L-ascorbate metabolism protein UlaG (beta-lactamase superfamily)
LEHWGISADKITEKDWYQEASLAPGYKLIATPARHFSGRAMKAGQSLWLSFVLQTPSCNLYLGADSGYDSHFSEIGEKYGPFDLAILECGQYDPKWKYIHMMPEEVAQANIDLKADKLMPVHWAKYPLSKHAWDDPIIRIKTACQLRNIPIVHPLIGEIVQLGEQKEYEEWWLKTCSESESLVGV